MDDVRYNIHSPLLSFISHLALLIKIWNLVTVINSPNYSSQPYRNPTDNLPNLRYLWIQCLDIS